LESVLAPAPRHTITRLPSVNVVPAGASNGAVTRDALERVGSFVLVLPAVEDWDLWIRLSRLGPPAVTGVIVTAYRRHGGNVSRKVELRLRSSVALERRTETLWNGEPIDWADLLNWTYSDALRAGDGRLAVSAVRQRHPAAVKRLARPRTRFLAVRRSPSPRPPFRSIPAAVAGAVAARRGGGTAQPARRRQPPPGNALGGPRGDAGRRTEKR
jgi:hypothetical protein